jgi:hypothetical protein
MQFFKHMYLWLILKTEFVVVSLLYCIKQLNGSYMEILP